MGFFDTVKKGADIAKKGLEMADEQLKKQISRKSDSELLSMDSSNKYVREELQKRGLWLCQKEEVKQRSEKV